MHFPHTRLRRMRDTDFVRELVCETKLAPSDLIYPVFVVEGRGIKEEITTMPGQYRLSSDMLLEEIPELIDLGIKAIALFPQVSSSLKSEDAKEAFNPDGLIQLTIKSIKEQHPGFGLITDVALDPYTTSGQDGISDKLGNVLNDETNEVLVKQALSHATAGADIVAPSDMMDGRIGLIRKELESFGHPYTKILAYSAKYASCFYSPFRDAVNSKEALGNSDKRTYQQDPRNQIEALREVALDIDEGADIVMIKPATAYLDVVSKVKTEFNFPTFAYNVSGEYSMLMMAVQAGLFDEKSAVLETLYCIKRSGADAILSYHAKSAAKWL